MASYARAGRGAGVGVVKPDDRTKERAKRGAKARRRLRVLLEGSVSVIAAWFGEQMAYPGKIFPKVFSAENGKRTVLDF